MYIPIISGPTGTGKTKLSIALAKKINGEIISADSMQIYKKMNIGTAKVKEEEMENIPHHMLDIINPNENFSAAEFVEKTEEIIEDILKRGKTPIIVGGTGLYINTLIYGIRHNNTFDKNLRNDLNKKAESEEEYIALYEKAKKIDPEAMEKLSFKDKKRVLRILEIYMLTGKNKTEEEKENRIDLENRKYKFKIFSLYLEREKQYNILNKRVDEMLDEGLIEENLNIYNEFFKKDFEKFKIALPKSIYDLKLYLNKLKDNKEDKENDKNKEKKEELENLIKHLKNKYTAFQAIGYKELLRYILGLDTLENAVEILKRDTRRYSKRQYTWFKKNNPVWIDAEVLHKNSKEKLDNLINKIMLEIEYGK